MRTTVGPCIVPFYIPEKYGVMKNSNMQDILYRAILNGTMQGINSIKKVQCKDFDLFANGTTSNEYYARTPCT